MRGIRSILARVRALVHRDRLDDDLRAELESHLALHIEDNLRAGMTAEEARRHAHLALGGLAQVEARYRSARGIPWLEHLARDARYGARALAAAPGFTLVAVATLGLGIGANTAIFSVINAVFFRPLPVERPEELVSINNVGAGAPTFSYPDYRDFRDRNSVLSDIAAIRLSAMSLDAHDRASRIWGYLVTGNYFQLLGVSAALGRTLTPADDRVPGGHPVLVLAHDFWQNRFAADPGVVGRVVRINGAAFTILGVMPAGFRGTERLLAPDVWVPMMMQPQIEPGNEWLERRRTENVLLLGRRRPHVSTAEAEASLNAIAGQLAREHPATHEGMRVELTPPGLVGSLLRRPIIGFSNALLGLSALVLLLACTNLTGLWLARSTDRQRDTSVRLALGASRADLVRPALVESALLSGAGATAALLLASWAAAVLSGWRPPVDIPLTAAIAIDHRVLIFSLGLAVASTLLVGILPAVQGTKTDVMLTLKEDTVRWQGGWHLRDAVVGLQVALSTLLLIGALLVVRSLQHAMTIDVGFNPQGAVSARVELGLQGYDEGRGREFQRRVAEEIATLPGIESVAVANALPLSTDVSTHTVYVEGRPEPRGREVPEAIYYQVSPGFFHTLQTRVVSGREFTPRDVGRRVAVVNQAFAAQLLGAGDPLGKRFRSGPGGEWIEVVGIVEDGKYRTLGEAATPVAFHPTLQWYNSTTTVVARSALPEGEALELIRAAVRRIDPALALFEDGALSDLLTLPLMPARIAAICLGLFGALAVALVLVGTYGAISYGIAQRMREICIRLAIGASSSHIVRIVLGRAAAIWLAGAGVGTAAAVAVAPLLTPILVGAEPRDPVVIMAAVGLLGVVTAAACWLPTRLVLGTNPSALLRRG